MKKNLTSCILFCLFNIFSLSAQASILAIIDSGTDMLHKDISPNAWINPLEKVENDRDEDRNGYPDDIYGWNFAESNNEVIDYKYLGLLNDEIRRFFTIQGKLFFGTATADELVWVKEKSKDKEFIKNLGIYGNFMHGTHVAGIASKDNDGKILAVKLIPTEVKLPGQKIEGNNKSAIMYLLKKALDLLAKTQMDGLVEIATYISNHKADVANGSFGTGYPQAKMIVGVILKTFTRNPSEADIEEGARYFLNAVISHGKRMVKSAPQTLFVFAAGNDALDNDLYPVSPTNIQADNVISVAATIDRHRLAPFSNYGAKMVDVAAPGVAIESTAPGDQYLSISGTSQAAPYVANIATALKDTNKMLSSFDIKTIIMKTVDKKEFLTGKVLSGGVVNKKRAMFAATLSQDYSLNEAISMAQDHVLDIKSYSKDLGTFFGETLGFVLPLPSSFVIKD